MLRFPQTLISSTNISAYTMVLSPGSQTRIILKQRQHQDRLSLMIPGGNPCLTLDIKDFYTPDCTIYAKTIYKVLKDHFMGSPKGVFGKY